MKRTYHLLELGPVHSGEIIRSQEMTDEQARELNSVMYVIKWVTDEEIAGEREKLIRLGYSVPATRSYRDEECGQGFIDALGWDGGE